MKIGIVGLPNVGKSTLFNALTRAAVPAENYPFCTLDPNVGVVAVPDARLDRLEQMEKSERKVPAAVEFVDIAGLVRGASRGEGLGNQFLAHIREVDAIAQVVRCFEDTAVTHVEGGVDPKRDVEIISLELCLADLETVRRRLERLEKQKRSGSKEAALAFEAFQRLQRDLEAGKPARLTEIPQEAEGFVREAFLLTRKPVLYIANVGEKDLKDLENQSYVQTLRRLAFAEGAQVVALCAKVEAELTELSTQDAAVFMKELGLAEPGLHAVARAGYRLLDLVSFFTAGPKEARAWTIRRGTKAPQAAGVIHSDMERGFIRAEVVSYEDLDRAGSFSKAREQGKLRLEGKDYVVQDGDVVYFRFNV